MKKFKATLDLPIYDEIDKEGLKIVISEVVAENQDEFTSVIGSILSNRSDRAIVSDSSFGADQIEIDHLKNTHKPERLSAKGTLRLAFDWYAHYGCSDMCVDGDEEEPLNFSIKGDKITFEVELVPERFDEL